RNAAPPAGPPARRPTRARTHRTVVARSGPTGRDPPESTPSPTPRRPVTAPPVGGALRRCRLRTPLFSAAVPWRGPARTHRPPRIRPADDGVDRPNPVPTVRLSPADPGR
ncbi:hypothetical protein MED01_004379, partial [Micromonospora sp. MED01]|nr:hypothetical protein [Micromonospora alfalfae]